MLEMLVLLREFGLLRQHLPATAVVAGEFLEPAFLVRLRQVEPEFHDQGAVLGQHALEVDDAAEFRIQRRVVAQALETVLDRRQIPATEQDRDLATRRHGAPEAPVAWPFALLVAQFPKGERLNAAGVEPFVESIHNLALAGCLDTGDDDDHRRVAFLQFPLRLEQLGSQFVTLPLELVFADRSANLCCFEHCDTPLNGDARGGLCPFHASCVALLWFGL